MSQVEKLLDSNRTKKSRSLPMIDSINWLLGYFSTISLVSSFIVNITISSYNCPENPINCFVKKWMK